MPTVCTAMLPMPCPKPGYLSFRDTQNIVQNKTMYILRAYTDALESLFHFAKLIMHPPSAAVKLSFGRGFPNAGGPIASFQEAKRTKGTCARNEKALHRTVCIVVLACLCRDGCPAYTQQHHFLLQAERLLPALRHESMIAKLIREPRLETLGVEFSTNVSHQMIQNLPKELTVHPGRNGYGTIADYMPIWAKYMNIGFTTSRRTVPRVPPSWWPSIFWNNSFNF